LCYVGRIASEKGVNEFVRVWLSCRKRQERLIVLGTGQGDYYSELLALAHKAGSAIDHRGYVGPEGVLDALGESHFLVLPSGLGSGGVRENFGIAVAEALGAGRPVLVTRGLAWDHIEQEGFGMLFDRSPDEVRNTIERARQTSSAEWASMAAAARAYAERELNIDVLAERVMKALRVESTAEASSPMRRERGERA
jgi:glycosyltransferase involved in cell wall biosynthesis